MTIGSGQESERTLAKTILALIPDEVMDDVIESLLEIWEFYAEGDAPVEPPPAELIRVRILATEKRPDLVLDI